MKIEVDNRIDREFQRILDKYAKIQGRRVHAVFDSLPKDLPRKHRISHSASLFNLTYRVAELLITRHNNPLIYKLAA